MKLIKSQIILLVLLSYSYLTAQSTHTYTYDANGNRISREVIAIGVDKDSGPKDIYDEQTKALAVGFIEKQVFEETIVETDITIYPNPTKGQMVVRVKNLPEGVKSGI
ncbi:MAG: hypothetical protein JEZ03_18105, partial [Bacteroidales bacterium]|nr:hypothetical protein [Bacteroidales bacterium]